MPEKTYQHRTHAADVAGHQLVNAVQGPVYLISQVNVLSGHEVSANQAGSVHIQAHINGKAACDSMVQPPSGIGTNGL